MMKRFNAGIVGHAWAAGAHIGAIDRGVLDQIHHDQTQFESFLASLELDEEMPLITLAEAVRPHEGVFAADRAWKRKRRMRLEEVRGS